MGFDMPLTVQNAHLYKIIKITIKKYIKFIIKSVATVEGL